MKNVVRRKRSECKNKNEKYQRKNNPRIFYPKADTGMVAADNYWVTKI